LHQPSFFTALADPTRRTIVERLARAGEQTVRVLTSHTPLLDWIGLYGAFWRDRFDRLETVSNRMDQ
jgi:hypothetical protein